MQTNRKQRTNNPQTQNFTYTKKTYRPYTLRTNEANIQLATSERGITPNRFCLTDWKMVV